MMTFIFSESNNDTMTSDGNPTDEDIDLFSRKSEEYNFFRKDDLDPTKQRLSHIAMLLEKLVIEISRLTSVVKTVYH